jgi:hypothetical protein
MSGVVNEDNCQLIAIKEGRMSNCSGITTLKKEGYFLIKKPALSKGGPL